MSSSLARKWKRKASRKMTYEQLSLTMEKANQDVTASYMSIPINVLFEKYHWTPKQLNEFANYMTEEYEVIVNHTQYAIDVYLKTGVGILRTEDMERLGIKEDEDGEQLESMD